MPLPPPHRPVGPGYPIRFEQLDPDIQLALLGGAGLIAPSARGQLIVANSIPAWAALSIGGTKRYLRSDGSDPSWSEILITDLPQGGTWDLGATDLTLQSAHLKLSTAGKGYYERARTTALGEWTAVAYNAGNFTASGTMTWTVAAGDQVSYGYTLIGKTMLLIFALNTTTVGGVVSTELRVAIPGGYTAQSTAVVSAIRSYDNGVDTVGFCGSVAGAGYIRCWRNGFTNWALSTDNTAVQGMAIFEIQ